MAIVPLLLIMIFSEKGEQVSGKVAQILMFILQNITKNRNI